MSLSLRYWLMRLLVYSIVQKLYCNPLFSLPLLCHLSLWISIILSLYCISYYSRHSKLPQISVYMPKTTEPLETTLEIRTRNWFFLCWSYTSKYYNPWNLIYCNCHILKESCYRNWRRSSLGSPAVSMKELPPLSHGNGSSSKTNPHLSRSNPTWPLHAAPVLRQPPEHQKSNSRRKERTEDCNAL